ncbi:hypothetical protein B0T16DRAFT_147715 [Cercophora newfieldiana]|uniref:Uncharacterized protein n=1 Tax=Cercophora newfieldiana TaxID=92897 RepID=A0AA40CP54_9PEZI|nr:hypothetical protein B0T16DRAFT_147715 [Cercophora newfieldiana]
MCSSTNCASPSSGILKHRISTRLASILHLAPEYHPTEKLPVDWLDAQSQAIREWGRPKSLLPSRRLSLLPSRISRHCYPSLACRGHRDLNASRLNRIAKALKHECEICLKPYVTGGPFMDFSLRGEMRTVALRLSRVLPLFGSQDVGEDFPLPTLPGHHALVPVKSRCPGCILAVVGGRRDVLVPLRASLRAHEIAGAEISPLQPLVDEWIRRCGGPDAFHESEGLAEKMLEDWHYWGTQNVDLRRAVTVPHTFDTEGWECAKKESELDRTEERRRLRAMRSREELYGEREA